MNSSRNSEEPLLADKDSQVFDDSVISQADSKMFEQDPKEVKACRVDYVVKDTEDEE